MNKILKIGTRGSELALWQAEHLKASLEKINIESELVIITTKGDKDYRPLKDIAGDGFFTKALENELFAENVDLAIHSCKDLASMKLAQLPWRGFGPRAVTNDVLILHKVNESNTSLDGLKIGTSSPRRVAQLKKYYPKSQAVELRGNVPTRMNKVLTEDYDGVILAKAGLMRLGLLEKLPKELIAIDLEWTTAPCQGILAIQAKQEILNRIDELFEPELDRLAQIEKSVLAYLGGGCHMAVGAQIHKEEQGYSFSFFFEKADGKIQDFRKNYPDLESLEAEIFSDIAEASGEKELILTHNLVNHKKVFSLAADRDILCRSLPMIEVKSAVHPREFHEKLEEIKKLKALIFTSQNAVKIFFLELVNQNFDFDFLKDKKLISIGSATAKKIKDFGFDSVQPDLESSSKGLIELLNKDYKAGDALALIGGEQSHLLKYRNQINAKLQHFVVYRTEKTAKKHAFSEKAAISFANPKAVENFVSVYGKEMLNNKSIFVIGPSTAASLEALGFDVQQAKNSGSWEDLLQLVEEN
ncbi:MAG: hydroxymethylbilane synthase [Bdellovibrionota bacterium]|nr:hydroxymethylbilane synthase [Bdellovibrionota bacterium]